MKIYGFLHYVLFSTFTFILTTVFLAVARDEEVLVIFQLGMYFRRPQ
jgi:hypothetical protein